MRNYSFVQLPSILSACNRLRVSKCIFGEKYVGKFAKIRDQGLRKNSLWSIGYIALPFPFNLNPQPSPSPFQVEKDNAATWPAMADVLAARGSQKALRR